MHAVANVKFWFPLLFQDNVDAIEEKHNIPLQYKCEGVKGGGGGWRRHNYT